MNRLSWRWLLLGGVLLILALLAQLPASLLASVLHHKTGGQVRLSAVHGSLWHGAGQVALGENALWEAVQWRLVPTDLLYGKLGLRFEADGGKAHVRLGASSIELLDTDLQVNIAPLARLDKRSAPYGLGGRARLNTSQWKVGSTAAGSLSIDWLQASSRQLMLPGPLGDYRVQINPEASHWKITVSTLGGALEVNGLGTWSPAAGLAAEVLFRAAPGSETLLAPLLNQVGPGSPQQERRLRFNFR